MTKKCWVAASTATSLIVGCTMGSADPDPDSEMGTSSQSLTAIKKLPLTPARAEASETPLVAIALPDGNLTSEAGRDARIRISLTSRPRGAVLVFATSDKPTEGLPWGAALFVPHRWSEPQDILVRGQDDLLPDGDQPYDIHLKAVSLGDPRYAHLRLEPLHFVKQDDDTAGLVVRPRGPLVTHEHGGEVILDISLGSMPSRPVNVFASTADDTEAVVSPSPLTFDPGTWQTAQPIVVRGVPDLLADGTVAYELVLRIESADRAYAELPPVRLGMQNEDRAAFAGIGDLPGGDCSSAAFDVNCDGTVVVGHSAGASGREAVIWTPSGGLASLGGTNSAAWGVDRSGKIVVGEAGRGETVLPNGRIQPPSQWASFWSQGVGPYFLDFPSDFQATYMVANGVSGNGELVVGALLQTGALSPPVGAIWQRTASGGSLIDLGGPIRTAANYDGSVVVGYNLGNRYIHRLRAWRNDQELPFPALFNPMEYPNCYEGTCTARALDISDDGLEIVGSAWKEDLARTYALRWSGANAPTVLPADGAVDAQALSISPDGRVVVGVQQYDPPVATRWIGTEPRRVFDLLRDAGVSLDGWTLLSAHGVSRDGHVIVGEGRNPAGLPEGWVAILP